MKRSSIIVAIIFALCLAVMPVSALETGVTIQGANAEVGEIVYLPLSLEETQEANTVDIELTFDRSALEFVASRSTWSISGTIRNFDRQREYAVWADSKTRSLNGELCRLAFRVKDGAKPSQCSVTCSVVLKIDSQKVAAYTAVGEITLQCQHSYGEWTNLDSNAHSRICQLCDSEEFGSHEWDDGTVTKEPTQTHSGTRLRSCRLCEAEQEVSIPPLSSPGETTPPSTLPSYPEQTPPQTTYPTQPGNQGNNSSSGSTATIPTQPEESRPQTPQPTQPGNQNSNSNSGNTTTVPTQPGNGNWNEQESQPVVVPEEDVVVIRPNETPEEPDDTQKPADEIQPTEVQGKPAWIGVAVIVCVLAAAAGIGFWLVKKKK